MTAARKPSARGRARGELVNGMETWFTRSSHDVSPPPKWKMAIVSMIAIYPLILLIQPVLAPLVGGAPRWLATLMMMSVMTPLMTWLALPLMIRLLRTWLYPGGSSSEDSIQSNERHNLMDTFRKHISTVARLFLGLAFLIMGSNGFFNFIPMPPPAPRAAAFFGGMFGTGYMIPLLFGTQVVVGALLRAEAEPAADPTAAVLAPVRPAHTAA